MQHIHFIVLSSSFQLYKYTICCWVSCFLNRSSLKFKKCEQNLTKIENKCDSDRSPYKIQNLNHSCVEGNALQVDLQKCSCLDLGHSYDSAYRLNTLRSQLSLNSAYQKNAAQIIHYYWQHAPIYMQTQWVKSSKKLQCHT